MSRSIRMGISTCPNDTFTFHGLLTDVIDRGGLDLTIELADVEELNRRLLAGQLDVAKVSFHAALLMADQIRVLSSGSALGYGVGPLLLAARPGTHPRDQGFSPSQQARVLCPGAHTTATLLYRLFHPAEGQLEQVVFSDIMPALVRKQADFGVCIHEGRFTWRAHGLSLVEDLGSVWERHTGTPLPLGGIVARRDLGPAVLSQLQTVVGKSLDYALANRAATLKTMRRYAQELDDAVIWSHVDLYVSAATRDLGDAGRRALAALAEQAHRAGVVTAATSLEVVE